MKTPRLLHRFLRRKDGATAVEFGVIALPFLLLMFAIMETALVFFAGQALETAAADSGRLILTGQAQKQKFDAAKFKEQVCAKVYGLFDCEAGLQVDVRTYASFAAIDNSRPVDKDGKLTLTPTYAPGGPGDIVVVRLVYQWPIHLSLLGFNLSDLAGDKRLLMATSAFRNEPFPTTQGSS
jgi:Flp pilus assembly protein TadG